MPTGPGSATERAEPPPISGGTLLIAHDGHTAVVSDPDRDEVYIVDLETEVVSTIPLRLGDQPWRAVEDGDGRVHVSLRAGGAVVTIDLASRSVVDRQNVCVAPRGVAFDAATGHVYLACASGELVELLASGGPPTRVAHLDRDLRDVIVDGDDLLVTHFRAADVLHVAKATLTADAAPVEPPDSAENATPSVAWRLIGLTGGRALMIHQRGRNAESVPVAPGGYSGGSPSGCHRSIVEAALTTFRPSSTLSTLPLSDGVLPVDVAVSPDESSVAVIAAGNARTAELPQVLVYSAPDVVLDPASAPPDPASDCINAKSTVTIPGAGDRGGIRRRGIARRANAAAGVALPGKDGDHRRAFRRRPLGFGSRPFPRQ